MNFSDIELMTVNDGVREFMAMKIRCQIKREFADIIGQPLVKFGGHYTRNQGTLVFGEGFLFNDFDEANDAAKLLVQVE